MMRELPVTYTLPFWRRFDVPIGALVEYAGMSKWLYRHPATHEVTVIFDCQPNSYARDQGGMKGTSWRVVAVEHGKNDEYQVTLDPV